MIYKIGFGGSCHWCTEAIFSSLKGVITVEQGWIASKDDADYFSEAVVVNYDPEEISLEILIAVGYTRARRYANYKGGKKYDKENGYATLERGTGDQEKAEAAAIFYGRWKEAEANPEYAAMKQDWKLRSG